MPVVTNKKTGEVYSMTDREVNNILSNPHLKDCFRITRATVPDEVKVMTEQTPEPKKAPKRKQIIANQ